MRLTACSCLMLMGLCCGMALGAPPETNGFILSDEDLPAAVVNGYSIAFTRNGAIAVSKGGRWLFDCGLGYALPNWSEWGVQVRKSKAADGWDTDAPSKALVTHGTLFDTHATERFTFTQRTEILSNGLRFSYQVIPPAPRKLVSFGLALHIPVQEDPGAPGVLRCGFRSIPLPKKLAGGLLAMDMATRYCLLKPSGQLRLSLASTERFSLSAFDDRQWQLNSYRLIADFPQALASLSKGETASFQFDLLLDEPTGPSVRTAVADCELDPVGRLFISSPLGTRLAGGLAERITPAFISLSDTAQHADLPGIPSRTDAMHVSYSATLDQAKLACKTDVQARDDSFDLQFKLPNGGDADVTGKVGPAFTLPISLLPKSVAKDAPKAVSLRDLTEGDAPRHTVAVTLADRSVIELASDAAWTSAAVAVQGEPSLALKTLMRDAAGGGREARVLITLRQPEKAVQE